MLKRALTLIAEYADAAAALLLALVFGLLGLFNVTSEAVTGGAILTTLAVIAFAIFRDRSNKVALDREIRATAALSRDVLSNLPSRLDRVEELGRDISGLHGLIEGMNTVRTLRGSEVELALDAGRQTTDHWYFKGGTGTYSRAATLPHCMAIARRDRRAIQIRMEIIDPTDDAVCQRYENFRRSVSPLPDGTGELWTNGRARLESFATVIAACWYRQHVQFLDVRLGLTPVMSAFRYDMFSQYLIITQDDPRFPALLVPRERPLFDEHNIELLNSFEQARRVRLELSGPAPLSEEPTADEVLCTLELLELAPARTLTKTELEIIAKKAIHAKNPYAQESVRDPRASFRG